MKVQCSVLVLLGVQWRCIKRCSGQGDQMWDLGLRLFQQGVECTLTLSYLAGALVHTSSPQQDV